MKQALLDRLSELTEEERQSLAEGSPADRALYAKSGRFIIERRRMSALTLGESTAPISLRAHPRFREFPTHSHDYIEMMYVCHGTVTHRVGEEEIGLEQDDLLLLGRHTHHSIRPAGVADLGINLIISADLFESLLHTMRHSSHLPCHTLERLLEGEELPYYVFHGRDRLALCNLMESMIDSTLFGKEPGGYLLQQSLALLLCYLAELSEEEPERADPYRETVHKRILQYIRTSYSTATLTEAAQMLGLSPPYLSRLCRECLGESFKELLMRERFSAACRLLSTTKMPVGDIINRVGYENSSYFHKEFKRRFGMTPREYRRR